MIYLAVATALVGLLATINLVLTFGVVRRLREHATELSTLHNRAGGGGGEIALGAGSPVGSFSAETVDGVPVTLDTLGGRPLVGFFSPSCAPCKERLPGFIEYAAARPAGSAEILAVVASSPEDAADMVEQLRPVATVVVEPDQGPVQQAFGITGFPAFVLVEDGVVAASGFETTVLTSRDTAAVPVGR